MAYLNRMECFRCEFIFNSIRNEFIRNCSAFRIEWRNMRHTILIKLVCVGIYSPTRNEWPIINSIVNFLSSKSEWCVTIGRIQWGKKIEEKDWNTYSHSIDFIINFERWDCLEYLQSSNRNNDNANKKTNQNKERRRRPNIGAHLNLLWWHTLYNGQIQWFTFKV